MDSFLVTAGTSGDFCLKKPRQSIETGKSDTKHTGTQQKESSKTEQTGRMLGMFTFLG